MVRAIDQEPGDVLKDGRITIGSFPPETIMNECCSTSSKIDSVWLNVGKGHVLRSHTCSICIALQNRNDFGYWSRGNADFKHDSVVFEEYIIIHFKLTTVNLQTPTLLPLDA